MSHAPPSHRLHRHPRQYHLFHHSGPQRWPRERHRIQQRRVRGGLKLRRSLKLRPNFWTPSTTCDAIDPAASTAQVAQYFAAKCGRQRNDACRTWHGREPGVNRRQQPHGCVTHMSGRRFCPLTVGERTRRADAGRREVPRVKSGHTITLGPRIVLFYMEAFTAKVFAYPYPIRTEHLRSADNETAANEEAAHNLVVTVRTQAMSTQPKRLESLGKFDSSETRRSNAFSRVVAASPWYSSGRGPLRFANFSSVATRGN